MKMKGVHHCGSCKIQIEEFRSTIQIELTLAARPARAKT